MEIRNQQGTDIRSASVNATLHVYAESNFEVAEDPEITVGNPNGLDITEAILTPSTPDPIQAESENPDSTTSDGTPVDTNNNATLWTINLSDVSPGPYTVTVAGSDDLESGSATTTATVELVSSNQTRETLTVAEDSVTVQPGEQITLTYTIRNPSTTPTSALIEYPEPLQGLTIDSTNVDISQTLLGSTPPGVVTTEIAPGASKTVEITIAVAQNASTGEQTFTVNATLLTNGQPVTANISTTISITEQDPIVARFGGSDGEIGNLDILNAVNAANNNEEIGGEPVTNLDILQLVNRVNQQ
jgi:hypothetical protein